MTRLMFFAVYLTGFPAAGMAAGYILFEFLDLISGPLPYLALIVLLIAWGGFGVVAGVYGLSLFLKMERAGRLFSESKRDPAERG